MGKHLVLVGGGHAHLTVMTNLRDYTERGHRVTLISPVIRHYYSGMGPGMLSGIYAPHEIRFNVKKLVEDRGGECVLGKVKRVDPDGQTLSLEDGSEISYEVVSFNTGSYVPLDLVTGSMDRVYPVKPIVSLLRAKHAVIEALTGGKPNLVVLGGGPAGLELSGNLWRLVRDHNGEASITLIAGSELLPGQPEKARSIARNSLEKRGINIIEGSRADRIEDTAAILSDGASVEFDMIFPAIGVRSYPIFVGSGLPTEKDGALTVTRRLHSIAYPNIFGGGDCINLEDKKLDRVGVYAVRQNPVLHTNLMAALEGGDMTEFTPQDVYMLIFNLGDGTGLFVRKSWVWNGRLAFILKNYVDQRFMKKFQVSGEREDTTVYPEG